LTQEREQQLEADALADGHSALMLERAKGTVPAYPKQPSNVWTGIDNGPPPKLGYDPSFVPDPTKVDP
jgi:hypothetical protein